MGKYDSEIKAYAEEISRMLSGKPKTRPESIHTIQRIYYGAPGTGKSYGVKAVIGTKKEIGIVDDKEKDDIRDDNNIRITFHPDTDYASFVGCYKPMPRGTGKGETDDSRKDDIVYKYQAEAFINGYVKAWKSYLSDNPQNFYLVIEEINRGNCAQIFGDMFQLLDRDENGYSSYKVSADSDLQLYLKDAFDGTDFSSEGSNGALLQEGSRIQLPPNFSILATMNTSDQSLFPMDSAFKRRWEWEYVKIDTTEVEKEGITFNVGSKKYSWANFVHVINEQIKATNKSTAKQIGPWFAKPDKEEGGHKTVISFRKFVSKVLFFLFNDAFRDDMDFGRMFDDRESGFFYEDLFEAGEEEEKQLVSHFLEDLENNNPDVAKEYPLEIK